MLNKSAYIKGNGLTCPFCSAELIEGGLVQIDAGMAFQKMGCTECEETWQDVYKLVDSYLLEGGDKQGT